MLSVHELSFRYGELPALKSVTAQMAPGRVTAVLGRNGAGKTTLMRTIMGSLRHRDGHIQLESDRLDRLPSYQRARAGVALVPQGRRVFPKLSVAQNIQIGLQARDDRRQTIPEEIYDQFPKLRSIANRAAGRLSGGEQQQLAIARALAGNPRVLLLDEPTEGIEKKTVDAIARLLRKIVTGDKPMTVVLVEQNLGFVRQCADEFYVLDRGRIVGDLRPIEELDDNVCRDLL